MNDAKVIIKFRESAITAVTRDALGLTIHMREIRRNAANEVETVKLLDPIRLDYADCSKAVLGEGLGYGMEVRLTRQAAMERDAKTGKPASVQTKWEAIKELRDHYASGAESWTLASAGPGLSPDTRALILAVQRVFGLDADAAEDAVRGMSAADRANLRIDPEVKPTLDAIYAEQGRGAGTIEGLKEKLRALKG